VERTAAFLSLLVAKKFFPLARGVLEDARRLLEERRGILRADLESAAPLGADLEERIREMVKRRTGAREVQCRKVLNPDLLGGYRLRVGDDVIDASLRGSIQRLSEDLGRGK
jgi:F-type H+-transporting ATPase subunit delta